MDDLDNLIQFRKLDTSENVGIPLPAKSRTITDKKGLIIYGVAVLILLPFLIYGLVNADLRQWNHLSDDCGNFCGVDNIYVEGIKCSGQNYSDKPYLFHSTCVSSCGLDAKSVEGRCVYIRGALGEFLGQYDHYVAADIKVGFLEASRGWWKILFSVLITIGLSLSTLVLLRYAPAFLVWGSMSLCVLTLIVGVAFAWYEYAVTEPAPASTPLENKSFWLAMAILGTIVVSIILIVFAVVVKKVRLVIQLYKEAVNVLAAMPLLMIVPILTTCAQFVILSICYVTSYRLFSLRELYEDPHPYYPKYTYKYSAVVLFTIVMNFLVTIWTMFIVEGVQYMIISGSVSKWYFSENRESLDSPILTSAIITFKFHLGTVAFGTFLRIFFSWVKGILTVLFRNICCRFLTVLYCSSVEIVLKFLSENAYIETALHGQSYIKSTKRATKLLLKNAKSVVAVNCVGDFVLVVMIILLTALTNAISFSFFVNNEYFVIPVFVCLFVNMIIVGVTFATFQTIIDTLLICFCEDSVLNDGVTKPFFMTKGLMEFIEASKKMSWKKLNH